MKKLVILSLCIAILLAASAAAQLQCSVVTFSSCPASSVKVIGMTSLSNDGSHASIPSDQQNAMVACCRGVEGLSVSYASEGADIYLTESRNAHVSRMEGENGIKISGVECGYLNECGENECVFSISDDRDAHISDCGNYAFERKLCCREGTLIGEEISIEDSQNISAAPELIPPSPEEGMKIAPETRAIESEPKKVAGKRVMPFHIKLFLKNFLRGGLVGNFLRVP